MAGAAPLILIAAGGTGGHMFPAQALAEALVAKGWRVKLSTDVRGARYAAGFPRAVLVEQVGSATFARGGGLARLVVPFRIAAGIFAATLRMMGERPAVVVGFGGYPTIPALAAALILRCPRMIHEQNGVPGKVNRLFARQVHAFACGTWPTVLPAGVVATHTGNPVRASVLERAGAAYIAPGDYPVSVVMIGGSQGARVLSDLVPAAMAMLPVSLRSQIRIAHQARPEDADRVRAAYDAAEIRAEVQPFFDDIPRRLSEAQLVISRAGASSLADITVIGRPSILVPFAAATGDHQAANARGLAEAGAAVVLAEPGLQAAALAAQIADILQNPGLATRMAAAALALGRPDATQRLTALVEQLADTQGTTR